jgi:shikimate kinase
MIISLTGFMGCGKSSVGRELSKLLCCPFMDLDEMIVKKAGRSIPEIFAESGESGFRKLELDVLSSFLSSHPESDDSLQIISLGGGTVMTGECAKLVRERTVCVYLRATVETLAKHLEGETQGRPMLKGDVRERIAELMAQRSSTYEETAHIIIDTDGRSVDEVSGLVIDSLSKL